LTAYRSNNARREAIAQVLVLTRAVIDTLTAVNTERTGTTRANRCARSISRLNSASNSERLTQNA
jgi:hypothetical protein